MSRIFSYAIINNSIVGVKIVDKRRGQALVEFVIILPVFILLVLGIIDIGKIIYFQNTMENALEDAVILYKADHTYDEILTELHRNDKQLELEVTNENNNYVKINLTKEMPIITPGLNMVITNPYQINVSRVISYEQ